MYKVPLNNASIADIKTVSSSLPVITYASIQGGDICEHKFGSPICILKMIQVGINKITSLL